MNTMVGSILLTILVFVYCFIGKKYLDMNLGANNLLNIMKNYTPVFIGSFCLLNCSTAASMSLEGNLLIF